MSEIVSTYLGLPLMSINEAVKTGVTKLRLDNWAYKEDYIEIHIADPIKGWIGPWVKLWSPLNEIIGRKNPQEMLVTMLGDLDDKCWRIYQSSEVKR